ncbi:MAG TPA: NifU family protein [Pyrinomonadaceae bacterium]|jgi:Fe-S cluster biogenesis protein NfuA/nitrite reductase/ring-hydroxylating ferredoxin subunit|nr:NifU family protein [Pyrinomonadaceae bacterium]
MDKEFQQRVQRVEELIREIELVADPDTRAKAVELVQLLMDFHGAGLERLMEVVAEAGEPGHSIIDDFARDGLVSSLLLLYGLHPLELETRVVQALDKVRPYLGSHGGDVELIRIDEGVVHLRMQGSCNGCPSSAMTLKLAIEEGIYEAAPDVTAIEVEGVVEPPVPSGLVQLGKPKGRDEAREPANGNGKWEGVSGLESLRQNSVRAMEVLGRSVLFCRLEETFYAYGNLCPGCGQTLHEARLESGTLICPACGRGYDCLRAGRGVDHPELHLEPFPLLMEQGRAKVAVPHLAAV